MVFVDNNILSSLAKIDHLEILPQIFDEVKTIQPVLDELHRDEVAGYEFVDRINSVKSYRGGWLQIHSLTEPEIQFADEIVDASLAFTDAACIAVAKHQNERLLTDDGHAGEIGSQHGVDVLDLKLLLSAALITDIIETKSELEAVIDGLRETDGYRFSADDRSDLFERL
ncbi:hypothetical protein PNP59_13485 [Halobacterium salinarum]|uniref:hypothetical protein n=1 Tax=Halobacterium salinarum TaxID=2242 RepID=UPI0025543B90|nr:hypothetical protein [Halobacterium salinarum]MDL0131923.1 hypothetical protein [Halobacterium salinarum]